MIYPRAAGSYEHARRVCERKSIWMVEYLRARREAVTMMLPKYRRDHERRMLGLYRRKHFAQSR